jgi:hypothetical protein
MISSRETRRSQFDAESSEKLKAEGGRGKLIFMFIYTAYLDESGTHDGSPITVMGGVLARAEKMLAVENDTTLNALAVEAFNDLLKKHGKRQSVENPLLD